MDPAVAKTLGLSLKGQHVAGKQSSSSRSSTVDTPTAAEGRSSTDLSQHEGACRDSTGLGSTASRPLSAQMDAGAEGGCAVSSSDSSSPAAVEDHVLIGTRKGEVLVCDAARQGLVVLRIPAIK